MSFVDVSIQFQVDVSEENPRAAANIVTEERPNHRHLEQMRMVPYSKPSDDVTGKQDGTAQDALRKALVTVERYCPPEWENVKNHLRPPALPDVQADDLVDMGILVDEVYDESIIEEDDSG